MTVAVNDRRREYAGNGITTVFNGPMAYQASHILAYLVDDVTGVPVQQPGASFTVLLLGREAGTRVVMDDAPPVGQTLLLLREVPEAQLVDITNQGSFNASVIERMADLLEMQIQQVADSVDHKIGIPDTSVGGVNTLLPTPVPTVLWGWDTPAPGDPIRAKYYTLSELANFIAYGDKTYQVYTGNGVQTAFSLSQNPGSLGNLDVSIDGVTQVNGVDFTYTGTTLNFTTAPPDLAVILIRYDQAVPIGTGISSAIQFQQAGTGAVVRSSQDKMRERVSLFDYMTPAQIADVSSGTGAVDVGPAIQLAFDYLTSLGGGEAIAPPGVYRTTAPLSITNGVSLVGAGAAPYTNTGSIQPRGGGTWFHFDHAGVGILAAPIPGNPVGSGAVIRGVGTFRTHAAPGPGWVATVYDWDIQDIGMDLTVESCVLLNPYKGITITSAGFGRLTMRDVKMQAFNRGVDLDQSLDTCRIKDVHVWPFWSQQSDVVTYMLNNLTSYRVKRADNSVLDGCFSIHHNVGVLLDGDGTGAEAPFALRLDNCNIDPGLCGIRFSALADGATVAISNHVQQQIPGSGSIGVQMLCDNAIVTIATSQFRDCANNGIVISGTGNTVTIQGTTIAHWNQSAAGFAAVESAAGNVVKFSDLNFVGGGAGPWLNGAGQFIGHLGSGLINTSTDASGDITVTHNFRVQPKGVFIQIALGLNHTVSVTGLTATNFTANWRTANTGAVVVSTAVAAYWRAEMF